MSANLRLSVHPPDKAKLFPTVHFFVVYSISTGASIALLGKLFPQVTLRGFLRFSDTQLKTDLSLFHPSSLLRPCLRYKGVLCELSPLNVPAVIRTHTHYTNQAIRLWKGEQLYWCKALLYWYNCTHAS